MRRTGVKYTVAKISRKNYILILSFRKIEEFTAADKFCEMTVSEYEMTCKNQKKNFYDSDDKIYHQRTKITRTS